MALTESRSMAAYRRQCLCRGPEPSRRSPDRASGSVGAREVVRALAAAVSTTLAFRVLGLPPILRPRWHPPPSVTFLAGRAPELTRVPSPRESLWRFGREFGHGLLHQPASGRPRR